MWCSQEIWILNTEEFQLYIIISLLLTLGALLQYLYPTHTKITELPKYLWI